MSESQDMKYEQVRLRTFTSWPANAKVEAWKMAKAGLLYTGQSEEVKCSFCGCILSDWQYGDQVMSKHRQASPSCPFVQNQSDNVPLVTGGWSQHQQDDEDITDGREDVEDTDDARTFARRTTDLSDTDVSSEFSPMEVSSVVRLHEDMKSEARRLDSFTNWSIAFIRPEDLAKAGFYYVNQRDNCRCAFCDNYVGDWEAGDVPMEEHTKLFPLCGFVRGLDVGNIPIRTEYANSPSSSSGQDRSTQGQDETGIRYTRRPNSRPEKGFPCSQPQLEYSESLGIMSHHGPLHPSYATLEARLRTFREWPPALKQQPQDLADAGFYYLGLSDLVKCFYCDGGLRNWQLEDDPWVEHARWFSKCVFVRLRKGDEFVKICVESKPPETSQEAAVESREVTEEDLRAVMSEAIVRQVLSMGIDHSRVKMAIKKQLENYGSNFDTPEHLINAAFSVQREQERRVNNELNNPSGAMLVPSRSVDEVTSRRWEDGLSQESNISTEDEDEPQIFASLPAGVRLNRTLAPAAGSPAPTPSASIPDPSTSTPASSTGRPAPASSAGTPAPSTGSPVHILAEKSRPVSALGAESLETLEQENAKLKEQRTCKVCMDGEVGVVFLPCGHLICCVSCAPSLKDCPVCRCNIQGTVRTFMS